MSSPRRNPNSTQLSFECDYVAPLNCSLNRFSRTPQPQTAAPPPPTAAPKNPPLFHLSSAAEGDERHITTPRQGDSQRRRARSTLDPYGEMLAHTSTASSTASFDSYRPPRSRYWPNTVDPTARIVSAYRLDQKVYLPGSKGGAVKLDFPYSRTKMFLQLLIRKLLIIYK